MKKINEIAASGRTIFVASHWMEYILANCNKAIFMNSGKIVLYDNTKKVVNMYSKSWKKC